MLRVNSCVLSSHHKYLLVLEGKLIAAPIEKTIEVRVLELTKLKEDTLTYSFKRCLDIGTGTGIWAIDFADEYPDTTVIGTDLSPIQPDVVYVHDAVYFFRHD